jgi:hypothetical protein
MFMTLNPNKNPFKLQVVMQQNRKNTKGDEYGPTKQKGRHCS